MRGLGKPLVFSSSTSLNDVLMHADKPKIRGKSLFDASKLLDVCPFCNPQIVASLKNAIIGKALKKAVIGKGESSRPSS